MGPTPQFRSDLYQGTARYYDCYRVPYPALLIDDLAVRAALSGTGRLLDLACGPGRVTFALSEHFADVLAIDQEEESVSYAKALAAERGAAHINWRTGRAEDLDVAGHFELVKVGDAFHTGSRENIPPNLAGTLAQAPSPTVLASAGLTVIGTYSPTATSKIPSASRMTLPSSRSARVGARSAPQAA
jgi:SAM-dependent methyltransferase